MRRGKKKLAQPVVPIEESAKALLGLLQELAPNANDSQIWHAGEFAARWIDQYCEQIFGTNPYVEALKSDRKVARSELRAVCRTIMKLENLIGKLSPTATISLLQGRTFIGRQFLNSRHSDSRSIAVRAGVEDLQQMIRQLKQSVNEGEVSLREPRSSKLSNPDNYLACGMAQTLGVCLNVRIAMTREGDPAKQKPTSANYWRLLKLAFELAGRTPPDDLWPIMKAGLDLAGPCKNLRSAQKNKV